MESDSDLEVPRKRHRTEIFRNECIICGEHGLIEQFCKPKNQESWTNPLEAATLRQFEKLLHYKEHPGVPDIYYHLECRKSALSKIKKKQSLECLDDTSSESAQRQSREKSEISGRVYAEVCRFCERKTKYLKGTKSREKVTQSVDLRADTTIREAATKKGDSKIMAIASRELVAAEAHYHISYKRYTCIDTSREDIPLTERSSQSMDSSEYAKIESEAYSALFEFLRSDLFFEPTYNAHVCFNRSPN